MPTYAIGDIQGCFDDLQRLIEEINFDPTSDTLWFCGDIINRGPKSLETIRFIKQLGERAITVLGNHDLHFLAVAYVSDKPSRHDTFADILKADDRDELVDWLRFQKLFYYDATLDISIVHAGIPPQWTIEDALRYASEVESVLQAENPVDYFQNMYGNYPKHWNENLKGWDRYRFITNVFTRMRFCDAQGQPHFKFKGEPGSQPEHLVAWFSHPQRLTRNERIIFGHWSTLKDPAIQNLYPIDTGCLWGGELTALKITKESAERIQINCPQSRKPGQ